MRGKDITKTVSDKIKNAKDIYNVFCNLAKDGWNTVVIATENENYRPYYKNDVLLATITKGIYKIETFYINKTDKEIEVEKAKNIWNGFKQVSLLTMY